MSLMDRITACAPGNGDDTVDFIAAGQRVGGVGRGVIKHLKPFSGVLQFSDKAISLSSELASYQHRTDAMAEIIRVLRAQGLIPGWRDETYPVGVSFSAPALFEIERAAVPLFGFKGYGVHLNGYVRDGDQLKLWVGKRSKSKPTGPGKLDQIVAGGQPVGLGLKENLIKECHEEANIPADLVRLARPAGAVSYTTFRPEGLRDDVLFIYDLELPASFQPQNTDGEVETFYLWSLDKIRDILEQTDEFKYNSALVVIDFMVRHGFIDAEDPAYAEIVAGLHR